MARKELSETLNLVLAPNPVFFLEPETPLLGEAPGTANSSNLPSPASIRLFGHKDVRPEEPLGDFPALTFSDVNFHCPS